ncbi:MAG TPA: DNA repair protein RadC [Candidatus Mailhella merdigallinarum]|uniref:DNA repair protein RadC n=1 Tax=Candidatus Mailhella merdigallinarum TaxID=2838658 RepID=A0A9D2HE49_9BACT|nr:RadC family protein [Desulfovibrionaceae bacterium]PWM71007.1 MAG: hypothetical protein DBX67_01655 [Desulfovibrionaceae bacterium]HJA08824.1 DNA repair protein RadC [Candidatus Mailhella merdigallinarum]
MGDVDKKHYTGHRARLRKRFLNDPHNVYAYEMMELLLGYVIRRGDTKPLAKELVERFGGIAGLLDAHPAERNAVPGLGPSTEAFLTLLREIIARYFEEAVKKKTAVTLNDIGQLGRCRLAGCPHEEVWAALLDNGNRLLTFERIHTGSVDQVLISPREAVELTLKYKASALVLLHNHPGGSSRPSTLDTETTNRLRQAMKAVGLRLLDHLILADGQCYSLTTDNLLA